jgi:hypothetical protein
LTVSRTASRSKKPGRAGISTSVDALIASCTTTHMVGAVSMNTMSMPSIIAKASTRSMPRSGVASFGSTSGRSECHSLSEPCGSASMTSTRLPCALAWAASCAVSVLLPAPPLRDASVMTSMGHSLFGGVARARAP